MFLIVMLVGLGFGMIARKIEKDRGQSGWVGFVLGAILGPIGILICLADDSRPKCPMCKSRIHKEALRCPHCRANFAGEDDDEDE